MPGGRCGTCGKVAHLTRKDARRARKSTHGGEHLTAYQCSEGWWHLGKLPPVISRGRADRESATAIPWSDNKRDRHRRKDLGVKR